MMQTCRLSYNVGTKNTQTRRDILKQYNLGLGTGNVSARGWISVYGRCRPVRVTVGVAVVLLLHSSRAFFLRLGITYIRTVYHSRCMNDTCL